MADNNNAAQDINPNSPSCKHWWEWLVCVIICWGGPILVVGLVFLIVRGIVREAKIKPKDPEFRLHSATVSFVNASASEFTAAWDVNLVAVNPNHKLAVSYHSLQATILYETGDSDRAKARVLLATKPVAPPQTLGTKTETTHRFIIETLSCHVGCDVAKKISEGRGRGRVTFELHMLGWYRYSSYRTELRKLEAACHEVEFGFLPGNWTGALALTGQSGTCSPYSSNPKLCLM